jgi:hypothetical protein
MLRQEPFFMNRLAPLDRLGNRATIDVPRLARGNRFNGDATHACQHGASHQPVAFLKRRLLLFDLPSLGIKFG